MAAAMQPYWQWRAIIRGGNGHLAPLLVAQPRQERGIRGLRLYRSFSSGWPVRHDPLWLSPW
jgi:hypothetical protein